MSLSLRSNVLSVVRSRAFHRLLLLQKLDLSNCQIRTVEIGAFEGLDNLQRVHLHGNWLSHIHATDIPPSLHGISLHANRY